MLITDLTFKVLLKELINLAIDNRKILHPKPQNALKTTGQSSMSGVSQAAMPVVTTVTTTSLSETMSWPTLSATSSGSTFLQTNPGRGLPQTRHCAAVSQGSTFKSNRPVTSQAVVQLLDVLDEVTEELQCEESVEEATSMEEVQEIVEEFQEFPNN